MMRSLLLRSVILGLLIGVTGSVSGNNDFWEPVIAKKDKKQKSAEQKQKKRYKKNQKKLLKLEKNTQEKIEKKTSVVIKQKPDKSEQRRNRRAEEIKRKQRQNEISAQQEEVRCLEKQRAADRSQQRKEDRIAQAERAFLKRRQLDDERRLRLDGERSFNAQMLQQWREHRRNDVREEYAAGAYADLYKSPARQTYATFVSRDSYVNVTGWFDYATDAYGSDGSNGDITRLAFGEDCISVQDILLVSKLAKLGKVIPSEASIGTTQTPTYLKVLADEQVHFLGQAESWGMSFDVARCVWNKRLVIGVQVPILYTKHRLRACLDQDIIRKQFACLTGSCPDTPDGLLAADVDGQSPAFLQRYGQDVNKFLRDVFRAKGFNEYGGSTSGLGDVTFFVHANIETNRVDSFMAGLRFIAPTAQKMSMSKLWAPQIGNGGFFEGALWMSVVMNKHAYFNPHLFTQINISSSSHVQRRVPKCVSMRNPSPAPQFLSSLNPDIPFGERVQLSGNAGFADFDTCLPNLGDHITCLKLTKGPEFTVRLGNIFEKFPLRRSFVDLYYDFRAQCRDSVGCLNYEQWMPDVYKKSTAQIEHKAGLEWQYQFDLGDRWRFGIEYTFAGQNVPKTFMAHMSMNYSF